MSDATLLIAFVTAAFLVAGWVKGMAGMGLPTVAMGLLSLVIPPVDAAAMLVIPSLITNVWQMATGPALVSLARRFAWMAASIVVGTFATIGLLTGMSTSIATATLGAVLAFYGMYGLTPARFAIAPRSERWLSPVVGLITGMLTGATGVYVVPVVPYLSSLKLEKEELVQSIGISAFVCPLALGIALAVRGRFEIAVAGSSLAALVPALAGMYLGQHLRRRLRPAVFRRWFFIGLLALGAYMCLRSVVRAYA